MKFKKAVLRVGTYHSPDGTVHVTPARLQHWASQFARMRDAKQVIPIDWDHASKESELQPLTMDAYQKRRSAKNTVGHLHDFQLSADGQGAELTLDVLDKRATEQAKSNAVYVSPVIFPAWKDGAGNEYQDCITHVDFVNHPVDHSQGKFEPAEAGAIACAIRMGLANPMRFSMAEDDKQDDDKPADTDPDSDADEIEEGSEATDGVQDDDGRLADVISALGGMNIVLSQDTTPANFLSHLHQALLTAAAHRGEGPGNQDATANPGGSNVTVAEQGNVALSLEGRTALSWAEGIHRKAVSDRLRALLDSGRCTPAEFKSKSDAVSAVRLSLGQDGQPQSSELERWIESREPVPEGTFWDASSRLQKLSVAQPTISTGELTREQIDEAANWALGRKK